MFCLAACLPTLASEPTSTQDREVAVRSGVLELAGAFQNDGFKVRDGFWTGTLAPGASNLVAVNLYPGNDYWFLAGATNGELEIEVFDESGQPVEVTPYTDDKHRAGAGFSADFAGQYFIRITLKTGVESPVTLVYSYK